MIRKAIFVPLAAVALLGGGAAVAAATGPARAALPSTVRTYCDHGNRLYVSESMSLAVVPQDPTCSPVMPTPTGSIIIMPPTPSSSVTPPPLPTVPGHPTIRPNGRPIVTPSAAPTKAP
jgi:hypothetical protein